NRIVKLSLSEELPHIAFDGYVGRTLTSSDERFGDVLIPDYAQYRYLLPLTLNYELDLWGKNRLKTKGMKKQLEMQEQEERALYISLSSNFAINYFNLIKTDEFLRLQDEEIKIQEKICDFVQKRYDSGLSNQNELLKEQKNLTFLNEEKNNLLEKREVLINQLNVLLADRSFKEIERSSFSCLNPDFTVPEIIDFDVTEKRPDVISSRLKLEKAGYDVKISKRNILPNFVITGNLGYNAYSLSNLFGTHTGLATIGVIPYLDIFDGGRKVNIMKLMKSRYNKAFEEYNKRLLTGAQDINDALYSAKIAVKNYQTTENRLNLQEKDFYLISRKEQLGTANIIDKLIKQQELILIQKQDVSSKINEIIASVNLYKAAGGVDVFSGLNSNDL
ncbi:MAG: TolC family protein, partial [Candidatus Gastranaerophilales bacterium]|nr:TolC family protein [Candidatus Gastranaerophilales bacterium]